MASPTYQVAYPIIVQLLGDLTGAEVRHLHEVGPSVGWDGLYQAGDHHFAVEYKSSAATGPITHAIDRMLAYNCRMGAGYIPTLVVPYMGETGRRRCSEAGVSWMDLSGNAVITAKGLRIKVLGNANAFVERGRPSSAFAAKSSRVARFLLANSGRFASQAEIARTTMLGDGYISRIVNRLHEQCYLEANEQGEIRPRDPGLLLDAWGESYRFGRLRSQRGFVPFGSGNELLHVMAEKLRSAGQPFAFTGGAAAWLVGSEVPFPDVALYLPTLPTRALLDVLEFDGNTSAANTLIALPNDDAVLTTACLSQDVPCVDLAQMYLDLDDGMQRRAEVAAFLRNRILHGA